MFFKLYINKLIKMCKALFFTSNNFATNTHARRHACMHTHTSWFSFDYFLHLQSSLSFVFSHMLFFLPSFQDFIQKNIFHQDNLHLLIPHTIHMWLHLVGALRLSLSSQPSSHYHISGLFTFPFFSLQTQCFSHISLCSPSTKNTNSVSPLKLHLSLPIIF